MSRQWLQPAEPGAGLVALIAVGSAFVLGAALGAYFGRAPLQVQIKSIQLKQTQAVAAARAADIAALQKAQALGDALTARLQATEATLTTQQKDLHDALQTHTTGRACLSGAAVRLLNASPQSGAIGVPAPTASAAAAPGAAAPDPADTSFASDTDVAQWAAAARTGYDTCRARLDALIDWATTP